ncbi:MAG: hypothetical protein LBQ06_07745 [Frankiaceae bacterium]|jgi:hypothetical protein|nr:hypothetical protein [Frankiaceae bacterium]
MGEPGGVELRVLGVSGTPPEDMLHTKLVRQVAGDRTAGFYRPRLPGDARDVAEGDPGPPDPNAPLLEGYSWGGLTSGAASRALWLLLLPFTLSNVAPRMRPLIDPDAKTGPAARWAIWYVGRLIAVGMTALFVLGAAGVSMDLYAWQCGSDSAQTDRPSCFGAAKPAWLVHLLLERPVQDRLVLGALLPVALVFGLSLLSGRTINAYEATDVPGAPPADDAAGAPPENDAAPAGQAGTQAASDVESASAPKGELSSPDMWRNEDMVRRLRHVHLQISVAVVLWLLLGPMRFGLRPLCGAAVALVILTNLVMLAFPAATSRGAPGTVRGWLRRMCATGWMTASLVGWGLRGAVAFGCAGQLLFAADALGGNHANMLPGFSGATTGTLDALFALVVVFGALIAWCAWHWRGWAPRPAAERDRRPLWGLSAFVVALMSVFVAGVFASGTYVYAAARLVGVSAGAACAGQPPVDGGAQPAFRCPDIVLGANRAFALSTAVCAALVALLILVWGADLLLVRAPARRRPLDARWGRQYWATVETVYPGRSEPATGDGAAEIERDRRARASAVVTSLWLGRRLDRATRYLAAVAFLVAACGAVLLAGHFRWSGRLCEWAHYGAPSGACRPGAAERNGVFWTGPLSGQYLQKTGAYLTVAALLGLVALGAAALRTPATRRSVGILWDIASFWPRAAHPLAAPCYAERTGPDLGTRMRYHIGGDGGGRVLLSGHSQGSVISAAAIFQLDPPRRGAVGLLTYGCVLRRLYGRFFPAYFGASELESLRLILDDTPPDDSPSGRSRATRWRNLWRHTDTLGGAVFGGPPQPKDPPVAYSPPPLFADDQVDCLFIDPQWDRPPGDTQWPAAHRHSDYWADPLFAQAADLLSTRLTTPATATPAVIGSAAVGSLPAAPAPITPVAPRTAEDADAAGQGQPGPR